MIGIVRAQVPLLRQRVTDTAALCVNCDAHYSNGVLVTSAAANGGPDVLRRGQVGVTSAAGGQAADSIVAGQPGSVGPLRPTVAASHDPSDPIQQPRVSRQTNPQVEDTMPPAPRAMPPVALQPREPPFSTGDALKSQPEAGGAARPATAPQREAAGTAGPSAHGHSWGGPVAAPEAAGRQATAGRRDVERQAASVFEAAEPPLPRMFPRSAAVRPNSTVATTDGKLTGVGEAVDGADDNADDECDYSPTSDPRLGPFARDPADRAPATPDRCRPNLSPPLQVTIHCEDYS
jgi:hypothetical protein